MTECRKISDFVQVLKFGVKIGQKKYGKIFFLLDNLNGKVKTKNAQKILRFKKK